MGERTDLRRPRRGRRTGARVRPAGPGLNHLAFHAASRDQVDALTEAVRDRPDASVLYEDRHPYAGGYDALYCEAPEGLKVEVVGPV